MPSKTDNFEQTKQLVDKIAILRGRDDNFGVVTKGFTKLDWGTFKHLEGELNIGVSSKKMKRNRTERKEKIWKYLQAYWLTNADKAYDMVKQLNAIKDGKLDITALVEDGMFEENIIFIVALYAEMLWDCDKALPEMINEVALRSYIEFA